MKKYRQSFLFVVLLTAFVSYAVHNRNAETVAVAQGPTAIAPADSDPMKNLKKQIDDFFENLSDPTKEDDKALEDFLKNSPLAANDKVRVKTLEGLKTIKENFGSYVSYEETGYKVLEKILSFFGTSTNASIIRLFGISLFIAHVQRLPTRKRTRGI